MPKFKPKPVPKTIAPIPKPKVINHRLEPLRQFVSASQYLAIKHALDELRLQTSDVTLRQIWAVVDHLVAVNDGREEEIRYAPDSKKNNTVTAK